MTEARMDSENTQSISSRSTSPLHCSVPSLPESGTATNMRNCHDEKTVRLGAVDDGIREARDEQPPQPMAKRPSALWQLTDSADDPLDSSQEILPKAVGLIGVVASCVDELRLGLGMKPDTSHRIVERALSKTSSAGTLATRWEQSSSSRRSASSSQSCSLSGSASGSRLGMSRSASRARSSGGRLSASFSIFLTGSAMVPRYHGIIDLAYSTIESMS